MRRTTKGSLATVLAVLLLAGCGMGSRTTEESGASNTPGSWTPQFEDGKLQPLPDGFPNQRLTLLNADEAGSSDGIYARAMQKALADISPVPVEVLDKPAGSGGTWADFKYIESKSEGKDGYILQVMAFTGAGLDFITDEETMGYAVDDMNPVIATESVPFVVVARGDAPWKTYGDMVDAAKAEPGQLKYIAVSTGSQLDIGMMSLMDQGGYTAKKIPLKDNVQVATTIAAGEGDFSMELPDAIAGQQKAGKVKVLLVVGDKKPALFDEAQTTAELGLKGEWGSLRGLMVTPTTPDLHRQWLYELLKKAQQTDDYQERLSTVPGATEVTMGHDEVMATIKDAMELATPVLKKLNLYRAP